MIKSLLVKFQKPNREGYHEDKNEKSLIQLTILGIIAVVAFVIFAIIWGMGY